MKKSLVVRMLLVAFATLVGVITSVHAQSANLLTNPGFEAPFEPLADAPTSTIAQGWTAWAVQDDLLQLPEYYPATDVENGMGAPRVHGGADAQQYFTFFAPHNAGVYQQVTGITAGESLTFSIYAYLWSSSGENPDASDGSGEISIQIGIDPNGGTDASADSIAWSAPQSVVDQYVQHTVTATAAADTVTVFVRSQVSRAAMNNTVYLDDAELISSGAVAVVPTEAATEAVATEVVAEVPTEVVAETAVPTDTPAVATEELTEAPAVVTEEPTEAVATEEPTEAPTNTEVPTEVPPTEIPTEAPPTIPPTPSPTLDTNAFPLMFPYTVVRGDTVGQLATRFGSTVEAIIIANQLGDDARIFETQQLIIPVKELPAPTLPPTATLIPSETPVLSETPLVEPTTVPTEAPVVVQPATAVPTEAAAATEVPQVVAPPTEAPIVVQPVQLETYVVQGGDSLSSIAVRFGVPTYLLAQENNIVNPNMIMVGQVLRIPQINRPPTLVPPPTLPPPPTIPPTATLIPSSTPVPPPTDVPPPTPIPADATLYTVMAGDNLYRISIRFNVSLADLIAANGILNPARIYVGQVLVIP